MAMDWEDRALEDCTNDNHVQTVYGYYEDLLDQVEQDQCSVENTSENYEEVLL